MPCVPPAPQVRTHVLPLQPLVNPLLPAWRSPLDLRTKKCVGVDLTSTVRNGGRSRPTWPTTHHNVARAVRSGRCWLRARCRFRVEGALPVLC
jgi:hypothetical protein